MHRLTLVLALSTLAVADVHAQPAPAPTPPTVTNEVRARALFKEGVRLGKLNQHPDALALFLEAYGLVADVRILFNIAETHFALGQYLEAAAAYQAVVDDATQPSLVPNAQIGITESERFLTRAMLDVATTDATPVEISIDGAPWVPLPPSRLVRVTPGAHVFRARGGGVDLVAEATVDAIAGTPLAVPLRLIVDPPPPVLEVAPEPAFEPTPPSSVAPTAPETPPAIETAGPARPLSGFGVLVHLVVVRGHLVTDGAGMNATPALSATGVLGATFAPHPRITLALGGMFGGNNAAFATATYAILPGKLRPTITAGGIVAFDRYDAGDRRPWLHGLSYEQNLPGFHGAVGGEWILSRRLSAIAEVAFDYYPSANEALTVKTAITPTVGVHARL